MKWQRDQTKEHRITESLKSRIQSGELLPGERLPAVREIAEHFQTSLSVVDRSFGNLEQLGLLERRPRRGVFVREPRRTVKRAAIVLTYLGDVHALFPGVLQQKLAEAGYIVSIFDSEVAMVHPETYFQFLESKPDLIIMEVRSILPPEFLTRIPKGVRLVTFHCCELDIPPGLNHAQVLTDTGQIGYESTRRLIAWGRRRILILSSPSDMPKMFGAQFIAGARRALAEAGLEAAGVIAKVNVHQEDIAPFLEGPERCDGAVGRDFLLGELIKAANAKKLRVPQDIDLVGFCNTPWAEIYDFSSMDVQPEVLAERAVAAALHHQHTCERIEAKMIERTSSASIGNTIELRERKWRTA